MWLLRNIRLTNNPCCCACRYVGNFPRWHLNKLPVRRMLSTTQCTYEQGHSHFYYIISKVNLKCENFISIKVWLIWFVELGTLFRIWVQAAWFEMIYKNFKMFHQPKPYFILNANFDKTLFLSNQIHGWKKKSCQWTIFENAET